MKKLFNGKFLFILASSLVVLILLALGAFYLFDDEDDIFVKSGYVLNPLSSTTEKYFFDEKVGYKENLSSMVEFVDVDNNTVSVLKDSFLHYLDDSLSFLKKGAILDLNSVSGNKAVSFYNITKESIIEKKDSNYVISSANGDIVLKNFVGRISDDKYIIVGDLSLKMVGNDTTIKGDYFEVVYIEEGIVNIENKDIKYQVSAEDTFIYVGNDKVIDLGNKKIMVNGEDLMSITAITIDGDENIEIIPKAEEEEEPGASDGEGESTGEGAGSGTGDETGEDGEENDTEPVEPEEQEEVIITLKDEKIGSTDISVVFEILNAREDDLYKLQVVNLSSGRTIDMVAQVVTDAWISVNLLTPNTKYLFTVINEKDNGKYFQKVIETSGFGIKLEKTYATSSSLAYKIMVDENSDISNAKLTLYKFNEELGQNEVVKTEFVDSETGEVRTEEKIIQLSSLMSDIAGEYEVLFDGLESDTIYTAVLDEFSVASSNFKDIYNITITAMTLKEVPEFSEMTITKDVGAGSFDLSLGNITDPDNAIVGYTYVIYDKLSNEKAIEPIKQTNASPITVKVGDDPNELKNDTNYYYNVIIEYFDNEKYIEYVTTDSIIFLMGNEPYITVVENKDVTSHDKIGATIYLTDNSCLISMPGRERCSGASTAVLEVSEVNPLTGYRTPVYTELVTFEVTVENIKYDLYLDGLTPGTTYNIEVRASYNTGDALDKKEIAHTDESVRTITTKELSSFNVEWGYFQGTTDIPINSSAQFFADENSGTLTPEESVNSIDQVVIKLYEGSNTANLDKVIPLATKTVVRSNVFDFKEKIYDQPYPITSIGTFELTMEALKNASTEGKLNEYYIITIEAYTSTGYEIRLINNIFRYRISSFLLLDEIVDPVVELTPIKNMDESGLFANLTNSGTYIGYAVTAAFDREQLVINNIIPQQITFRVYNSITNEPLKFYIKDENGELQLVDSYTGNLGENNYFDTKIFMDYGTPYETVDDIMRRGNQFYIGYSIQCLADGKKYFYPESNVPELPTEYGVYRKVDDAAKEVPGIKMYIATSDATSVTYSYVINDPDNALYKDALSEVYNFYYMVNGANETALELTPVTDSLYNKFEGRLKIDKLFSGCNYSLYYYVNNFKTGVFENDVLQYMDDYATGIRVFDGYYNAKENVDIYNFKYSVINDDGANNKVTIRILADEKILKRIINYKLEFKDSKGHALTKDLWKLEGCPYDNEGATPRCLSVDYTELKNADMKSAENETNLITVKVTALYDNGLTGYDYKVGNSENDDYIYCIMQDYINTEGVGSYISFSAGTSPQVTVWSEDLDVSKGYYQYAFASGTVMRYWGRHTSKTTPNNISINLTSSGYLSKHGFLNPKMISIDEMESAGINTFSFSSITPKVRVVEKSALINGSALNLTLSGIDLTEMKRENDFEYYLYVETWNDKMASSNLDKVIRPAVKVKINKEKPTATVSAVVDGLQENTNHYFRIYAYMRKANNEYKYTNLYDAAISYDYITTSYEFKTARATDIFHSHDVSFYSSEEVYGNRILSTKMNLLAYRNNIAFNFDVVYVLCKMNSEIPCGVGEGETHIFKQTVPADKISTSFTDEMDISEYDLEFGTSYYMYIYAHADYYDNGELTKRDIVLNRMSINTKLRPLTEPSFVVTRNAGVDKDGYYIDFNVVISDKDRTLDNGNYFVKLLDTDGNVVGNMKLEDENGGYIDIPNYTEYPFDAFVVSKNLRIAGLEPNSKYTFIVYGDAYLNNYSEDTLPGREYRMVEISRAYTVFSANDYGVAFGDAITYGATAKSIIVTFLGGSNFNNVVELSYTVGLWNAEDDSSTVSGTFVIGQNGKRFELYSGSEDWRFVIDPEDMKNTLGKSYEVTISVKVKVPGTNDTVVLTSADIPGFEGKAVYVED